MKCLALPAVGKLKSISIVSAAMLFLSLVGSPTLAAVYQLTSPNQISNSTTINFEGYSEYTVANALYQSQGITFSRDDGEAVFIGDWAALERTTVSLPNVLLTISGPGAGRWATHLNVSSSSGLFAIGAYFGNDQNGGGFEFIQLSAYDSSSQLLGSVRVYTNNNTSVDQFIGLRSDTPFSWVRFENFSNSGEPSTSYSVCLDDLSFSSVPTPLVPVANSGEDQVVFASSDGMAAVMLDGSDSNDPDGNELTYKWTWTIDANTYEANGASPTIELPVGIHTIHLVVNNGLADSQPDDVNITVLRLIEGRLKITPQTINRRGNQRFVAAIIELENVAESDIDVNEPFIIYPGEIKATRQQFAGGKTDSNSAIIYAAFDKDALMAAMPSGDVELEVVGKLGSGQFFLATQEVKIIH